MSIITNVSVYTLNDSNSKTVALATVTISDCLVLTGLRIVKGKKGMFVSMPQRKLSKPDKNGNEYADIFLKRQPASLCQMNCEGGEQNS